jgi:hypothetical protein
MNKKQNIPILYIKNICRREVNLYDIGIRLQPEQVFNVLRSIGKIYTLEMLNNSIAKGSIRKNINLKTLVFTKKIEKPIDVEIKLSTKPLPSHCKIKPTKNSNNENELLIDDEADHILDEWLDISNNNNGADDGQKNTQ